MSAMLFCMICLHDFSGKNACMNDFELHKTRRRIPEISIDMLCKIH
jgi:hypothetical protein